MKKYCIAPVILLLALIASCAKPVTSNRYALYALEYGESLFPEELIADTASPGKQCPFSWFFYCLKTEDRVVLVDTGFADRKYVASFRLTRYTNPLDLLKNIGVKPEDVTDIILTHTHFDHAGTVHFFPNARIYIRRAEYDAFRTTPLYGTVKNYFDARERRGLLHLPEGEFRFSEEVRIIPAGGHTVGSQGVIISSGGKAYWIVGDECYLRKYCDQCRALPEKSSWSRKNNILFLRRMISARQKEKVIILPMHDPVISTEYPAVREHIYKIF
ncbi:MAG TPA: N-acyl homoserine lactonase family protein [Spirochaetota bacterium]|nr:N-acyl homoserine lactonase family protein [Spirochaetota bacterium]